MRRVRKSVNFALSYFIPAENLAGAGVNAMLILVSAQFLQKHNCVEDGLENDIPKLLFIGLFALRLLVAPLLSKGIDRFYPLSETTQQKLFLFETEFVTALKTVVFVLTVLKLYNGGIAWSVLLGLLSTWPLEAQAYRFNNPNFSRGTYNMYQDNHSSPLVALYFAMRELLYAVVALPSAIELILSFSFNMFWDSAHEYSYPNENKISIISLMLFGLLGMSSVFGKTIWNVTRAAELSASTFFYTFMFSVSMLQCAQPGLFSVDGFKQAGWYVSMIIGLLSLLPTIGSFVKGLFNPYEKPGNQKLCLPFWQYLEGKKDDSNSDQSSMLAINNGLE